MKQRTTFIISDAESTHPDNFEVSDKSLNIKSLPAVREDHFTLSFDELPEHLRATLQGCRELVIHWASGRPYESTSPYVSRVPPGLHVFVAPEPEKALSLQVCPLVEKAFGVTDCKDTNTSFSEIPGARQFYSPAETISPSQSFLKELICGTDDGEKCGSKLEHLKDADYVDFTYDAIAQTLVVAAYTARKQQPWQVAMEILETNKKVEVGVLGVEKPIDPESFTISGFVHVVGHDKKLEPVYFTFPSRHHRDPSTYRMNIGEPAGLHPKLNLHIEEPLKQPEEECTLNAYYTLPRTLFVDKYQLSSANPQLLESLNIKRLRDIKGEIDLEAPAWASDLWGSSVLIEVDTARHEEGKGLDVELPVHTRYQDPQNTTLAYTRFAEPSVFWACRSEDWTGRSKNPFHRVRLGYEHLFPEQTMFYHLSPQEYGWKSLDVPVLDVGYADMVKAGTFGVIVAGFLWVLFKTISTAFRGQKKVDEKKTQ